MTTHASGNEENKLAAAEEIWAKLLEGNKRFVAGKPLARDLVARRTAAAGLDSSHRFAGLGMLGQPDFYPR